MGHNLRLQMHWFDTNPDFSNQARICLPCLNQIFAPTLAVKEEAQFRYP